MPRSVFVHETIDIVGQGQYDYMEMVNREPAQHMPDMTSLQGTFYVLGFGGGRWPQVINIWDCGEDGWDGWGRNLDRLNLKRRKAFYGTGGMKPPNGELAVLTESALVLPNLQPRNKSVTEASKEHYLSTRSSPYNPVANLNF